MLAFLLLMVAAVVMALPGRWKWHRLLAEQFQAVVELQKNSEYEEPRLPTIKEVTVPTSIHIRF